MVRRAGKFNESDKMSRQFDRLSESHALGASSNSTLVDSSKTISHMTKIGDTVSSIANNSVFGSTGTYDPFIADTSASSPSEVLTVPMSTTGDSTNTTTINNSYSFAIQSTPNASADEIASAVMKRIYTQERSAKERQH